MFTAEQLARQIAVSTVAAWVRVAEHAHAHGVDSVLFPGETATISPREARRRLTKRLDHPQLIESPEACRFHARSANPKDWGATESAELARNIEYVETLAWAGSLRRTLPGWGGVTPMPWSFAARLISTPFDAWMPKVRVRSRAILMNANRQAAAWRWRVYADYYHGFLKDNRKEMRTFAKAVTLLVPTAAKLAAREGWFKAERGDFPLGSMPFTYDDSLSHAEREELYLVSAARSCALRDVIEHETAGCEIDIAEAWRIMLGDAKSPVHPIWPFKQ